MSTRSSRNLLMALAMLALSVPPAAAGGPKSLDKHLLSAHAWLSVAGQPDHRGNDRFMPLPMGTLDTSRNVFVGSDSITLRPNEGFFLPIFYWFGESYLDGSQDATDFPEPSAFLDADVLVMVDGVPIVDSAAAGLDDFYVDTTLYARPLEYDEPTSYGSVNTYFVKGLAVQHDALSPGTHVVTLLATSPWLEANFGFLGWDNTWTVTVTKD